MSDLVTDKSAPCPLYPPITDVGRRIQVNNCPSVYEYTYITKHN